MRTEGLTRRPAAGHAHAVARERVFRRGLLALVALTSGGVLAWRAVSVETLRDPIAAWPWMGGDTPDYVVSGLMLRGVPLSGWGSDRR